MKTNLKKAWRSFMSLFNKINNKTNQISIMNIFVSSIPFKATQQDLNDLFSAEGRVQKCHLVLDKQTKKSKGFGFVEMEDSEARKAIAKLNGSEFMGCALAVKEALPRD